MDLSWLQNFLGVETGFMTLLIDPVFFGSCTNSLVSSITKSSSKTAILTPSAEFRGCQMLLQHSIQGSDYFHCFWLCFLLDQDSRASNNLQSCIIPNILNSMATKQFCPYSLPSQTLRHGVPHTLHSPSHPTGTVP